MRKWILARLSEKTTWVAIVAQGATLLGATLAPELKEAIITTGLAVTSLVLTFMNEKK